MAQSYDQLSQQIIKRENLKHFHTLFDEDLEKQEVVNNQAFQKIIDILKERFLVLYKLVGEDNFNKLVHEYFKYNPLQSASSDEYGKSFPHFLQIMDEVESYPYLVCLAELDWFWSMEKNSGLVKSFPKGTLKSWGSIYKGLDQIEIQINLKEKENLSIIGQGNEFTIKVND